MKVIEPDYGRGIILGIELPKEEFTIDMLSYINNLDKDYLQNELNISLCKEDNDWLNFSNELKLEDSNIELHLIWPGTSDDRKYIIGIFIEFTEIKHIENTFKISDQIKIEKFKQLFKLNVPIIEIVSISKYD